MNKKCSNNFVYYRCLISTILFYSASERELVATQKQNERKSQSRKNIEKLILNFSKVDAIKCL